MPFRDQDEQRRYHQAYQAQRAQTHKSVKLTMSLEEYLKFEAFASAQHISVAKSIVHLATAKRDSVPTLHPETRNQLDEIVRLLRASGNNINQIAHACNVRVLMDDSPPTEQEGAQFLKSIHEGMLQLEIMIEGKLS